MLAGIAVSKGNRKTAKELFANFITPTGHVAKGYLARTYVPGFCRLVEVNITIMDKLENGSFRVWTKEDKSYELKPDVKVFIEKT